MSSIFTRLAAGAVGRTLARRSAAATEPTRPARTMPSTDVGLGMRAAERRRALEAPGDPPKARGKVAASPGNGGGAVADRESYEALPEGDLRRGAAAKRGR